MLPLACSTSTYRVQPFCWKEIAIIWTYNFFLQKKQGRTVVQLQYKNWPVRWETGYLRLLELLACSESYCLIWKDFLFLYSGFPENISYILQFITEVHSFYKQQRSLLKPIVVHCRYNSNICNYFSWFYFMINKENHLQPDYPFILY